MIAGQVNPVSQHIAHSRLIRFYLLVQHQHPGRRRRGRINRNVHKDIRQPQQKGALVVRAGHACRCPPYRGRVRVIPTETVGAIRDVGEKGFRRRRRHCRREAIACRRLHIQVVTMAGGRQGELITPRLLSIIRGQGIGIFRGQHVTGEGVQGSLVGAFLQGRTISSTGIGQTLTGLVHGHRGIRDRAAITGIKHGPCRVHRRQRRHCLYADDTAIRAKGGDGKGGSDTVLRPGLQHTTQAQHLIERGAAGVLGQTVLVGRCRAQPTATGPGFIKGERVYTAENPGIHAGFPHRHHQGVAGETGIQ